MPGNFLPKTTDISQLTLDSVHYDTNDSGVVVSSTLFVLYLLFMKTFLQLPSALNTSRFGFNFNNNVIKDFNIVGLLVGGSSVYNLSQDPSRDWDGLIVVKDIPSVVALMSNTRALSTLLMVVKPGTDSSWWDTMHLLNVDFEGVRFYGFTPSGLKKSVKIIAKDLIEALLKDTNPRAIRILSQKDIRLYSTSYLGRCSWRVQPVTTISVQQFILHDADIYVTPRDTNGHIYASFGCTMDLLLTGRWVYQAEDNIAALSLSAIHKYSCLPGVWIPVDWTAIFSRNARFPDAFRRTLRDRPGWGELFKPSATPFNMPGVLFWLEDSTYPGDSSNQTTHSKICSQYNTSDTTYHDLDIKNRWVVSAHVNSQFSGNSTAVRLSSLQRPQISIFCKKTAQWQAELLGASRVQMLLANRVHLPLSSDPVQGAIFYPWFEGESLSDLRLKYYAFPEYSIQSTNLFEVIIQAEMRKAEDMLSLYCRTASTTQRSNSNIQQFFCDRIPDNRRIRELYPQGVLINGTRYDATHLMSMPATINGKPFPSLLSILEKAPVKLRADDVSVLGLGDGHGGNVLIGNKDENSAESLRYIDYEAAGRHSPWLDMAKPTYNDIFYSIFYADLLGRNLDATKVVHAVVHEHSIDIALVYAPDTVSCSIWQVRKRYFLEPFVKHLKVRGFETKSWNEQLGLALLCCAMLTRSFHEREDMFFANMALGMLLSQWNGTDDFEY